MSEKYIYKNGFDLDNLSGGSYTSQIPWPEYLTELEFLQYFHNFHLLFLPKPVINKSENNQKYVFNPLKKHLTLSCSSWKKQEKVIVQYSFKVWRSFKNS